MSDQKIKVTIFVYRIKIAPGKSAHLQLTKQLSAEPGAVRVFMNRIRVVGGKKALLRLVEAKTADQNQLPVFWRRGMDSRSR